MHRGEHHRKRHMIEHREIFINGQWVESSGSGKLTVINPATEQPIATVPRGTAQDVDRAARAAADAFDSWSRSTIEERVRIFKKAADFIEARVDEITRKIVSEVGHPWTTAEALHSRGAVEELKVIVESLPKIAWEQQIRERISLVREAAGVVGAITPWNGPLVTLCTKAGAAIAAGCTVVLKPSEVAPLTSFIFAEAFAEAGLPPGVLNVLSGTGPEVGEAIVTHPLVEMVSFTGSLRAGRRIMEMAAPAVKRLILELGGKSPNIILDDADLELAVADGIKDAFRNTGQSCGCLTRMLVPRAKLAQVEAIARRVAESYVVGDPMDRKTTIGPLANANQYQRVREYIQAGIDDGMRLVTGGTARPAGLERGYFVRPTVFSGNNTCRTAREEIFGPVLTIIPYRDEADAIAMANDSLYGLAGGVWSGDPERARRVARRLRTGRVRINAEPMSRWAPHGGFKLSGFGREWGQLGIEEFTSYKSVIG
jgi:aldehyde dehydrogenase (NAD+)